MAILFFLSIFNITRVTPLEFFVIFVNIFVSFCPSLLEKLTGLFLIDCLNKTSVFL